MRILLIEGDDEAARQIERELKSASWNVDITGLGEEGVDLGKLNDHDIILLAADLPDISGLQVLRSLRTAEVGTPILVLGRPAAGGHNVTNLCAGADGYMSKPVRRHELVARIDAIVRRARGRTRARPVIRTGALVVDLDIKTAEVNGERVHLTGREYHILELLSLRKGRMVTRDMVRTHLYRGAGFYRGLDEPELGFIDVLVAKLRRKLALAAGGNDYIRAIDDGGFQLVDPA
jgi:two-component system, cell cycle response regulator CtrA